MFLETQLDEAFTSQRSEIRFVRELLQTFGSIELIAKEVHSRGDLEKFLTVAREDSDIQAVHIVAHGERARHECALVLTSDVDDYEAFLTESLFYHLAYGYIRGRRSDLPFVEVYERLRFALDYLLIDPDRHSLAEPLLAAVFPE